MSRSPVEARRSNPTMRALIFDGGLRLGALPRPRPDVGQALVRVSTVAIARVDLDMVHGRRPVEVRPVVLGHQFVGVVAEVGERVDAAWVGRRVVAARIPGCRRCVSCRFRRHWLCEEGSRGGLGLGLVDGAFAEWVCVGADTLHEVPESVDDDEAVFAHPVSIALQALEAVQGPAPQRVLVVGDGNMGLLVTLVLHAAGHTVSVFGRHPSRRELLWRSGIGFTAVPDQVLSSAGAVDGMQDHFATVFECSGRLSGFGLAAAYLRPRGRIVLVSDYVGQPGADLRFLVDLEAEILGVSGGPLEPALEYLSRRTLDVLPLVSARVNLVDGVNAFERAGRRGSLKVLLGTDEGGAW